MTIEPNEDGGSPASPTGPPNEAAISTTPSPAALYVNTECDGILITDDKLKLKLIKFRQNRRAKLAWIAPLGVVLTLALTLSTAQFHETFGLSGDTLKGIAITAILASAVWLLIAIFQLISYLWRYRKLSDIDEFIQEIKMEVTAQRFHKPPDIAARFKS